MELQAVRVFIGSGEQSLLERKVLIHSLRKHTRRPLDLYVLNGTHNAIERNSDPPVEAPLALALKYRNLTEFSLYRYLIPQLSGFQGKSIYMDSDCVCLADIGELFDTDIAGCDFLAKADAYAWRGEKIWASSVMLMDCARVRFDLLEIFREIDHGLYSYTDFSCFSSKFLALHPHAIGTLDPHWNVFDRRDANTRLIHFTELTTQPWKFRNHQHGELWFDYFREAQEVGLISDADIELAILRGAARRDLRLGNSSGLFNKLQSLRQFSRSKAWLPWNRG